MKDVDHLDVTTATLVKRACTMPGFRTISKSASNEKDASDAMQASHERDQNHASSVPRKRLLQQLSGEAAELSHATISRKIRRNIDQACYPVDQPREEQRSVIVPKSAISALTISSRVGCSVYDARVQDSTPSPPVTYGPKLNRVQTRRIANYRDEQFPQMQVTGHRADSIDFTEDCDTNVFQTPELPLEASLSARQPTSCVEDMDYMSDTFADNELLEACMSLESGYQGNECISDSETMLRMDSDEEFTFDDAEVDAMVAMTSKVEEQAKFTLPKGSITDTSTASARGDVLEANDQLPSPINITGKAQNKARMTEEIITTIVNQKKAPAPHVFAGLHDRLSFSTTDNIPQDVSRRPISRKPFQAQVTDRPLVMGLSTNSILRTCFRVGEALNAGCQAARLGHNVVLELYARVQSAKCESGAAKQHLVLADLYHDNPPFISAVFESRKGMSLSEKESAGLLDASQLGRMCRVVGAMQREPGGKWVMMVRKMHEVGWEDVEHVANVYA